MISTPIIVMWIVVSLGFGVFEYALHKFFTDNKLNSTLIKLTGYIPRLLGSMVIGFLFAPNIPSNEFIVCTFGFYFLSSFPAKAMFYQIKNKVEDDNVWFFSHSDNHLIKLKKLDLVLLDGHAFGRLLTSVFGAIMLCVELCN